jgi:hypothetical protein
MGCRPEDVQELLNRLAAAAEEAQDPVRRRELTSIWGWMAIHSQRLAESRTDEAATGSTAGQSYEEVTADGLPPGKSPEERPQSRRRVADTPGRYTNQLWANLDDVCREALRLLGETPT